MNGNIFKLKKDKINAWREWAAYLNANDTTVKETLEEENISFEGSFIFTEGDDTFVCLYSKTKGEFEKKEANLEKEINIKHREKMHECFEERVGKIENLYLFDSRK